ncbi:MAG: hydrolase [Acidimicrobiia bacterium]|nr:hydrolase [Acidimicrobiia bacterium]
MTARAVDRLKGAALWSFGRLPGPLKVRLVRLGSPSFTFGAMVCIERDGSLLLTRSPHHRGWTVPGGLLKRGEDPADGARREIFEELGVRVVLDGPPAYVVDAARQVCDVVFQGRLAEGDEPSATSYEVSECRWFRLDQLPPLHQYSSRALTALRDTKRGR